MSRHISTSSRCITLFVSAAFVTTSLEVYSCPAFLGADKTPEWVQSGQPSQLRLFAIESVNGLPHWSPLPIQIDPLNREGVLDIERTANRTDKLNTVTQITANDRIAFEVSGFGPEMTAGMPMPCNADQIGEVIAPMRPAGKRHGYIAMCTQIRDRPDTIEAAPRVRHDQRGQKLVTSFFEYNYVPTNQLLFKTLTARMPDGRWVNAGSDSDFRLRLDPKRFFTLNFTNKDVESYVEATHAGNVGVVGLINFYLRILMFKIDLKMATLASFYEKSANIPMIVDIPLDASKRLNPGSGMTYSYKLDQTKIQPMSGPFALPIADANLIKKGASELAKVGLKNCDGDKCVFRLSGAVDTEKFLLDMDVPKNAVENGFFPFFVADLPTFKRSMGWKVDAKEDEGRIGFYFENSGLPKGRFQMDYWIRFASDESGTGSVCPSPAEFIKTITNPVLVGAPSGKQQLSH